jgi:CRP/FNR family transcriptional regulator, nitrogen fixation regulation protein
MTKLQSSGASLPPTQLCAVRPQPLELQVNSWPVSGPLERMGAAVWFPRDGEIYRENSPADYLYRVISGTVRTYKALNEGRRQIGAFCMAGDIFGLEAGEVHAFSAEAITDTELLVFNRSAVVALAARNHNIVHELWSITTRELKHVQGHALLLIQGAQERVANFLLEIADRVPASDEVELPMSRQDIADYLGLTIETVSRMLTQLERAAAIALPTSRRVVLRSRSALKGLKPSLAERPNPS